MSVFAAGCVPTNGNEEVLPTDTMLPAPEVYVTETPDVRKTIKRFLDAWVLEEFDSMYAMLSASSQGSISEDDFVSQYETVATEIALTNIDYLIQAGQALNADHGEVQYTITLNSAIIGSLTREYHANLIMEDGNWRVEWDPTLIMPELIGGNYLAMERETPVRAGIFDRNNNPLAAQTEAVAIGLYPDFVDLEDDNGLLGLLSTLTNYKSHTIAVLVNEAEPGEYLALGEIDLEQDSRRLEILRTYGAAITEDYTSRLYYGSGIGPHVTGYVSAIQKEEIDDYRRLGFQAGERVGREGLESWGNELLTGVHGGTLYVFNSEGKPIEQLGSNSSIPGKEIITTIDRDFQYRVQQAMSGFSGAAVVMERDTGRVLALVSKPDFNPNAFEFENYNWSTLLDDIVSNPDSPQFNRATQGQYPLGSVNKIITMAAALENGGYSVDTSYDCQYDFTELQGLTLYDWTYEHFLEDETTRPSGTLTLPEGLIRSCNPFFWHIGLDLYKRDLTTAIYDMSIGFGLGNETGIEGIVEEPGNIPIPQSQVDATNLAIGQGDMQVTPLQVVTFVAALGNGGTINRPQVIEGIKPIFGDLEMEFQPDPSGELPISRETLNILQEAMVGVVRSQRPQGTAYPVFTGLDINVAGKTGSATTSSAEPHAWFAGYTFEERDDLPDIAIVVIAENAGEGSEIAAPIFRRIVEEYFYGAPRKKYRWEAIIDVTKSPTLPITETPTEGP